MSKNEHALGSNSQKSAKNGSCLFCASNFLSDALHIINGTLNYFFLPLGDWRAAPTIIEKGNHSGAVNTAHLIKKKIK